MIFEEKTISSEIVYEGPVFRIRKHMVETVNGGESARDIVEHSGGSILVAITDEGKVVMERQYRKAFEKALFELPAGKADPGEIPDVTAVRELQEETGYTCEDWEHILTLPAEATVSEDFVHLYRAKNCRKVSGQTLDDMEFLHVELHTAEEIDQLIREGRFQQISHVAAWRLL